MGQAIYVRAEEIDSDEDSWENSSIREQGGGDALADATETIHVAETRLSGNAEVLEPNDARIREQELPIPGDTTISDSQEMRM